MKEDLKKGREKKKKVLPLKVHHLKLPSSGGWETKSPEFLAINPAGTVPVLVHKVRIAINFCQHCTCSCEVRIGINSASTVPVLLRLEYQSTLPALYLFLCIR